MLIGSGTILLTIVNDNKWTGIYINIRNPPQKYSVMNGGSDLITQFQNVSFKTHSYND